MDVMHYEGVSLQEQGLLSRVIQRSRGEPFRTKAVHLDIRAAFEHHGLPSRLILYYDLSLSHG